MVSSLYSLIHARYVLSPQGIQNVTNSWKMGCFPRCVNKGCRRVCKKEGSDGSGKSKSVKPGYGVNDYYDVSEGGYMIPTGVTDQVGVEGTKFYCPICESLYDPDVFNVTQRGKRGGNPYAERGVGANDSTRWTAGDGAAWGTSFVGMFLVANPGLWGGRKRNDDMGGKGGGDGGGSVLEKAGGESYAHIGDKRLKDACGEGLAGRFKPTVFGFNIHESSRAYDLGGGREEYDARDRGVKNEGTGENGKREGGGKTKEGKRRKKEEKIVKGER